MPALALRPGRTMADAPRTLPMQPTEPCIWPSVPAAALSECSRIIGWRRKESCWPRERAPHAIPRLLPPGGLGIVVVMPARHTERPDLFAAAASKAAPAEGHELAPKPDSSTKSAPPRYLLPKDLAGALTRLSDAEIDTLLATVIREAERRGRLQAKRTQGSVEAERKR